MVKINPINFILHIDNYLSIIIENYSWLTYIFLFAIIFLETGLVVAPFLPGDSLIFVAGTFAAKGALSLLILFMVMSLAAVFGDTVNYWIGNYFGKGIEKSRLFRREYFDRTKGFYDRYGGKAIVFARFIPIVRTFVPFVAGIGKMNYGKFIFYNIIGGIIWVALFLFSGYFFGGIPFVKNNLSVVIIVIIISSLIPIVFEYVKAKLRKKS